MFDANILPVEMRASTSLTVNYAGLGSINLRREAPLNWEASIDITTQTTSVILGEENFNPVLHAKVMSTVQTKGKALKDKHYTEFLTETIQEFSQY